ncbi:isovaleryl-CoA dehydrogenase [Azoarcus sp. L1K30]|uniref:isovaleryl-CoA dehydrogenase n=1 Tax=Azoarcus sp. L1K30 TaxID=2820277 RepID=UPI001B8122F8|nr:isovaleryl-CoA dehydrogenase [Azoarcus sp. L1K30]MBR0565085.1 isovaleryl-CoA dehydrogenase [Azoarcus sp. L1K30]
MPETHHVANQPPPLADFNRFTVNRPLRDALLREGAGWADEELAACGAELGSAEWIARGETANRNLPRLRLFDRVGHRLDSFDFDPAWHQCLDWLKHHGLAGGAWRDTRRGAAVRRAALFQLFAEVECGSLCPTTMSHGAVPVLTRHPEFSTPWAEALQTLTHDPRELPAADKRGILVGMGMTEKQGGSDVRANTTRAEAAGDGWFALTGHKWFFSVPTADAHLVTAQAPGGLSCFLLPRYLPDGRRNTVRIQRAKDKLGDHANASAEVEFDGALARLVGEEGRGIPTVLEMAHHTRLDCANGSAGIMRGALNEAVHHARHRHAFGKALIEQPLMAAVLADLALETAGHSALCLRVAATIDRRASDDDRLLGRLLTPLAKYWVCKRCPAVVAEAMEVLGGNGYIEEGPLARPFRQSPLNSIWEGAGNVMCLDVLRVLAREPHAIDVLVAELERRRSANAAYNRAVVTIKNRLARPHAEAEARHLVTELAIVLEAGCLLGSPGVVGDAFCATRLGTPPPAVPGANVAAFEPRAVIEAAFA